RPGMMTRLLYWATQVGLRGADRIIVLGEDMRAKVMQRGIDADKTALVPNWADTTLLSPRPRTNPWPDAGHETNGVDRHDSLVVMYSGNLGLSQNLEQLLEV